MSATLLWFRRDLRLQDNPALEAALARGAPVVPVYIRDDAAEGAWRPGAASRWWLRRSLAELDAALRERGSRLLLRSGPSGSELWTLIRATRADAVYWNRGYEPAVVTRDASIERDLAKDGIAVRHFNGALLYEPITVANRQGGPFQVFSAYWRHCLTKPVAPPIKRSRRSFPAPERWPASLPLSAVDGPPVVGRDSHFTAAGKPGEREAQRRLAAFVKKSLDAYAADRDKPGCDGTSRLSAALHFGEISPRQIWSAVEAKSKTSGVFPPSKGAQVFLSEIGWREFAYHLLFHFPRTPEAPLREEFAPFPWAKDPGGRKLRAWQQGLTGYPIVDAGMRQLRETGWMHNRVRMIAASFLVKHLRLPWQRGAAWFWENLVDADLANNTLGWQWSAGCGADAAPYFRVFAPVLQGRKFDADGTYVRRWVPELRSVPAKFIHAPWKAPSEILAKAGVALGENYPQPIVDHATARAEALAAFKALRRQNVLRGKRRKEG